MIATTPITSGATPAMRNTTGSPSDPPALPPALETEEGPHVEIALDRVVHPADLDARAAAFAAQPTS